ncbi:RHS repeat-associated core domain-containing protein [Pseudomonas sp. JDS28PS106]|uniref:RHS repeat-associated core domain-containing protein n=1 Tax=Pseudomonas sp. JDS28PS106 TaxID=2497235 RepID=UPI002FD78C92
MVTRATYHYDPLDRLAVRSDPTRGAERYFYCDDQRSTEIGNGRHRRFLRSDRRLVAQQDGLATLLLLTDRADSVLAVAGNSPEMMRYTPYGHYITADILAGAPGFNGEHPDPLTGHYPLGNGYRSYNPVLMRFNGPDSLSPFGEGGINAYAYCAGDPINRGDSTGHLASPHFLRTFIKFVLPGKVINLKGHVVDLGKAARWQKVPRAPKPVLEEMPREIKEKILDYMAWNEPSTVARVDRVMYRRVMAESAARFKRLKIADLPYRQWVSKLDQIGLNKVPGITPGYLKQHGLSHEIVRELQRSIRDGEFEEASAALQAAQLQAMNGAGW